MANSITIRIKNSSNNTGEYFDASEASISAPDSGGLRLEKNVDGANDGMAFFAIILFVVVLALGAMMLKWWRRRKVGFNYDKRITKIVTIFAVLVSAGFVIGLQKNSNGNNIARADFNDGIEVNAEDIYMEADVSDGPVYVTQKSTVTVKDESGNGYTLLAFVEGDDALQLEGGSGEIANLESKEYSTNLEENTWGLATKSPNDLSSKVFRGLENDGQKAVIVDYHDGSLSAIEKTIDVYYGAYLTSDLSEGTYVNRKVNFVAVANKPVTERGITVNFHGNGLYFDDEETEELNTVIYGESHDLDYKKDFCTYNGGVKSCNVFKTDNIDMDGKQEGVYNVSSDRQYFNFPGAKRIAVDIKYGLAEDTIMINIAPGIIEPKEGVFWPSDTINILSNSDRTSEEHYELDGDELTMNYEPFYIYGQQSPSDNEYGYGLYAKIYPIYETEDEESASTLSNCNNCPIVGKYKEVPLSAPRYNWIWEYSSDRKLNFKDEDDLRNQMSYYPQFDGLVGKMIDIYAGDGFMIYFDKNDGSGEMEKQFFRLWGMYMTQMPLNNFTKDGYEFLWWNTEPDGSGFNVYQSMNMNSASIDKSLGAKNILYAQWRPITNP